MFTSVECKNESSFLKVESLLRVVELSSYPGLVLTKFNSKGLALISLYSSSKNLASKSPPLLPPLRFLLSPSIVILFFSGILGLCKSVLSMIV
ncbi:Uncharacterised protein [Legionella pneumophila]|nr:Uncharacterised protein [Legionella pneumophila]